MLTVSSGYKNAHKQNAILSNGKISVYDTVALTTKVFDNTKVGLIEVSGSSFFKDKIFGNFTMHDLKVELYGDVTADFALNSEKHITPSFGILVSGSYEWVDYQKFIVKEVTYDETTKKTKIYANDFLIKFNVDFVDTNSYPMTLFAYAQSVATYCGLTLENTSIVNGSFSITSKPFPDYTGSAEILSKVAELGGYFIRIKKSNGKVELVNAFNKGSSVETFTLDNYFDLSLREHNFGANGINTLVMKISQVEGENNTVNNPTNVAIDGAIEVQVVDNDIVNTETKRLAVINNLFTVIEGFKFTPFILDYIGYSWLEIGDRITITKSDNTTFTTFISDVMIRYDGGLKGQLRGQTLNKVQTTYRNLPSAVKRLRNAEIRVDKVEGEVTILAGDYYDGKLEGAKYVFDGTNATFTNGGLIIKNALGETVFTADIAGNLEIIGKMTATSGKIGRFDISGDDLVYTSDLFNKEYDYGDTSKLSRILAGLDTPTAYENEVYDVNNSGTLTVTDLVQIENYVKNGTALPTPRRQIRSVIRMGTTSGEIRTTAVSALGNTGKTFVMKAENLTGELLNVKGISAVGGTIQLLDVINGVRFPATFVGSTDPNTLDDYEEGTFTPVLAGGTTAGTGTYNYQYGKYTKIGRVVHVAIELEWSDHTGTGNMRVRTLPFITPSDGINQQLNIASSSLTYSNQLRAGIPPNSTEIVFYSNQTNTAIAGVAVDTSGRVYITGTYMV